MKEKQPPLAISYGSNETGVSLGWSVKGRDHIIPSMPVYSPASREKLQADGVGLSGEVHKQALSFFNGPLSRDLRIPKGYPYEFYEPGKEEPIYTGKLRTEEK